MECCGSCESETWEVRLSVGIVGFQTKFAEGWLACSWMSVMQNRKKRNCEVKLALPTKGEITPLGRDRFSVSHPSSDRLRGSLRSGDKCLREGFPLARPSLFALTQSGLRPGEGRRTGGSRRVLRPPRSHTHSHLAFGHVPFSGLLTRKSCSRTVRSAPPATLPLPREAALCFIKKHQGQDEGICLRSHQTRGVAA